MSIEGLDRDLENARVLLEDKPWCDSPEKYRKTAETIIVRFLAVDPQNKTAKALLEKSRIPLPKAAAPPPLPAPLPELFRPPAPAPVVKPASEPGDSLAFLAQAPKLRLVPPSPVRKNSVGALAGIVLLLAIAGGVGFLVRSGSSKDGKIPQTASAASVAEPVSVTPPLQPEPKPSPVAAAEIPAPTHVALTSASAAAPAAEAVVVKSASRVVVPIPTGTLAISSPTTVDIYLGDKFVGSAPTTLELPAGNQSLEYRHEGMRKVVTHVIRPHGTTTAMITFEIPVQINARPWAQVSIDGSQRHQLGQTPLSAVQVPIGSMLLFENPNYPSKTYRVTGGESEIRVNFP